MRTFKCDRCGDTYQPLERYSKLTLSKRIPTKEGDIFKYVDLCPTCYESLGQWLKMIFITIPIKREETDQREETEE